MWPISSVLSWPHSPLLYNMASIAVILKIHNERNIYGTAREGLMKWKFKITSLDIVNFDWELYDRTRHRHIFTQLPYRKCRVWHPSPKRLNIFSIKISNFLSWNLVTLLWLVNFFNFVFRRDPYSGVYTWWCLWSRAKD
jgi:hypothetical protein